MALNIVKLIDLIKKHNDPNDATRIISIQGTSVANFFPERMKKDDVINIESGDIVWKEYGDHKEQDPVIYRTGLNNIDQIKFIPAPGEDIFLDNGKVDTGNGKDTVEGDDGTKYKLIPGPQGDKGETGARGEKGEKGDMSIITLNKENGHWMIDGVDTEVSAIGPKGDKVSVTIDPNTKHWMIDGVDTEVVAEGKDGKVPEVKIDPVTKRWIIGGIDTNIVSEGVKGDKGEKTLVTIDPNTKHWLIDGVDTNVLAEGVKGDTGAEARLSIDPETKHFIINGIDSGVRAEGVKGIDGVTPEISINEVSKNWIINGHDTEIKAEGTKGDKGEKTLVTIDPNTKHWLIDGVDTNVLAEGTKGADGVDGKSAFDIATEKGFTGSKDEWLESLKGAKGADGHDGRSANNLEVDPILLGNFRNNDASGIEVLMIGPRFNDEELSESDITENLQVTALFRGFNLRNSNENDEWKDLNNLTIEPEDGNYVVKGLPFTDGVRKGDSLELILNFEYKGVDRHYYRRLDNINDGVGSVNLDKYIRREDLPATLDTSHLIARKEVEENYAKKSELPIVPSLDPYSKKEDADNKYATKESLSSVSVEVSAEKGKLSSLTDRVTAIEESKSTLATKEEVDTTYAKKSELPVVPSLDPYATKAESDEKYVSKEDLVTLGNLNDKATKADLKNYYTKEETVNKETHDALNNKVESNISEISTVKEKVTGLESSNTTVKEKIESLTSDVNSLKAKEDSDKQTLSLEGNKLAISSGNEVDLSALKTDNSAIERSVSTLNETVTGLKNRLPESIQEDDKLSTSKEVTEKVNSLKTEVETNYAKKSELPSVEGLITESKADGKYSSKSLETTVSSLDEKVRHLEAKEDNDRQTLSITDRTITISGSNSSVTVPEQDLSSLATKADIERDYAKKSELPSLNGLISEAAADTKYLPKSKEESLATKEELDTVKGKVTALESKEDADKQTLSITGRTITISGSGSSVTVPEQDLSSLATKDDVELTYAKKEQVEKLASKSEIEGLRKLVTGSKVDTSGFITTDDADSKYARKDVMETTYAKKSDLPSVEGLITEVKADGKYLEKSKEETLATKAEVKEIKDHLPELTEGDKLAKKSDIPSLTNYATKEELPSITGLISETRADEKYIAKSTESSLATKEEVTQKVSEAKSNIEGQISQLATKNDVDTTYAKKSELPSVTGLISEVRADEKYLEKSKETTLATKDELSGVITRLTTVEGKADKDDQTLSITGRTITISGSDSSVTIPEQDLSGLATKTDVELTYAKKEQVEKLATKSEIEALRGMVTGNKVDTSGFITTDDADSKYARKDVMETTYAKKSELPTTAGLISEATADTKYLAKSEKEALATKEEVKAIKDKLPEMNELDKLAKTSDIPSLESYAKKSELPSVTGLITEVRADEKYLAKSEKETLATKEEVKEIKDHLPELVEGDKLAKKSELPSVTGLISEATADTKYLEKSKETTLATKEEVTQKISEATTGLESQLSHLLPKSEADKNYLSKDIESTLATKNDIGGVSARISTLENKPDNDKQLLSIVGRTITISGSDSSVTVPEQDLSGLAKKSELPSVEGLITEVRADEKYIPKDEKESLATKEEVKSIKDHLPVLTGEEKLAKTSDIPSVSGLISEATADTKYLEKSKEATLATKAEVKDITDKLPELAKKSEIPSIEGLITEVKADGKYALKTDLETAKERISVLESKEDADKQTLSIVGRTITISGSDSSVTVPEQDLSTLVTKDDAELKYAKKEQVEQLASKSEIEGIRQLVTGSKVDTSGLLSKEDAGNTYLRKDVAETSYAKKSELPSVEGLIAETRADEKYVPKADLETAKERITTLENKTDNDKQTLSITGRTITISGSDSSVTVPEQDLSGLATKADIERDYAKKSELSSVNGLISEATADTKYLPKSKETTLATKEEVTEKVSEAVSGIEGEIAVLANKEEVEKTYAKKSELPSVTGLITEVRADEKYLEKSKESTLATKEELNTISGRTTAIETKLPSLTQDISISGNELSISGGSTVHIPTPDLSGYVAKSSLDTAEVSKIIAKNTNGKQIATTDDVNNAVSSKTTLSEVQGLGYITTSAADDKYLPKTLESQINSDHGKVTNIEGRLSTLESRPDNDRQTLSIDNRTITISGSNSSVTVPEQDLSGLATKTDVERDYAKKSELPNVEEIKRRVSKLESNGGGSSNTNNGTKYYVRTVEELKALDVQVDDVVRFKDKVYKIVKDVTPFSLKYFGGIILDKIVDRMNLVAIEYTDSYIRNSWIKNRPSGNFNIAYCGYTGLPYKSNANLNSVPCTLKAISDAYKVGYDGIYVPTLKYFNNKWYISTTDEVGPILSNSQGVELLSYSYKHTRINSEIAETKTFNSNNYVDRNLLTVEEFLNVCKKYNMYAFMSIQTINKNTFDNSSQEAYAELARIINDSGHSSMIGLSGDNIQIEILDFVIRVRDKILSENLINVIFIDASTENYTLERELLILQKYKNNLVIIGDKDDYDGNEILSAYGPSHKLYNFLKEVKKMGIPIVYQTDRREQRELFDKVIEKTGCIGLLSSAIAPYGKNLSDNYTLQSRNNMSSIINLAVNKNDMNSRFTMNSDNTIMTATASNITQNNEFELLNVSDITDGMLIRVRLQGKTSGSQNASCKIYVKDIPDNENVSNMISFNSSSYKEREMILPLSKNTFNSRYNDKKVVINLTADSGDSIISFKDLVVEVLIPKDKDNTTTKLISSVNYESYNNKDIYVDSEIQKAKLGDMIHYNNEDYVVVSKDDELISGLVTESTNGIIKIGENYALRIHNQEDINQWLNGMKNTDNIKIADGGFTGKSNVDNEFVPVYPKNTTLSVEKAGELGFDAVKVNITPTKDNVWVCSDETTLVNVKDNSFKNRNIADLNYDNIKGLELEGENVVRFNKDTETYRWTYRDGQCKGQTTPSLEQIVKICSKYGMMIFITSANLTANFDYVTKVLKKYGYTSRTALVGDRFIMKYSNKLPDAVSIFDGSMNNVKIYNEKFLRTFKNFGFTSTPGGVNNIFGQTSNFKIDIPFFLNANYQYNLGNYQSLSNFRINGFITGAVPSDLNIREGYSILRTYTSKEINEWTDRKNNNSASASVVKQSNGNIIIQSSGGSAGKYISFERNLENYPVGTIINISAMCRKIEKNVDGGTISFWSDANNPRRINTFTTYFNEEFFEKKDVSFIVNEETGGSFQIFIGNFNGVRNDQPFKAEFKDIVVRIYVPNAVYRDIDKESIERKIADISFKTEMEIRGEGYPRNKSELNNVPNGTIYTDTLATKGAVKWIKLNGKWKVTIGDTGWKKLNTVSTLGNAFIKVRRVNDIVTYNFGGLSWGWFGIIRRNGKGFLRHNSSGDRGAKVLAPGGIPDGFRSDASLMGPIFNDLGKPYGVWYMGGKSDSNYMQFTFNDAIPTDKDIGDIRVSSVSYITDDDWENITIE